jgi:hypothetical protein
MNYELAKELKSAGFPQGEQARDGDILPFNSFGYIRIPTLSEHIEACGKGYFTLQSSQLGWEAFRGLTNEKIGRGNTPEIAVASLWLSLQKK